MFYHLKSWKSWQVVAFSFTSMSRNSTKNPFNKILSPSFDLGPLKVNTYCVRGSPLQFCKGLSKGFIYSF